MRRKLCVFTESMKGKWLITEKDGVNKTKGKCKWGEKIA